MDGISPNIWRHHKPEVTSSKLQLRRIPSSWVSLDWLTTSQLEHSGCGGGGVLRLFFGKHMRPVPLKNPPNLVGPKFKTYTPFWVTYREKLPVLHHFIPGFCEKFKLFHIVVDFDTLTEWSD